MSGRLAEKIATVKGKVSLSEWCESNLRPWRNTYVCPACNSGGRGTPDSDSAFRVRGETWHCFSCNRGGDVLDLAGIVCGTDDKREQLRSVSEWAGIDLDGEGERGPRRTEPPVGTARAHRDGRERHRAYVEASARAIGHPDAVAYLDGRGISRGDAARWGLGYDAARGRIVIPWAGTDYYHVDRDVTDRHAHKYEKPGAGEVGPQPIWNASALDAPVFFVVEGAFDALAVQSCGYEAIALGGTGGRALVEAMARRGAKGRAVLLLDSDDAGRAAQERLASDLASAGAPVLGADIGTLSAKDAFEAYAKDRGSLEGYLGSLAERASADAERAKDEAYALALARLRVVDPVEVAGDLFALSHAREMLPTGLEKVDRALGGGLPSRGLVVLGAVSSVGKTTFAVQVADHLALEGRTVLFVTVEQSAEEIVAKSLSRLTSRIPREGGESIRVSTQAIASARERERWVREDPEKVRAFVTACECYNALVHRPDGRQTLHILEAASQPAVLDVRTAAEEIARHTGEPPIIFIDYLQLLAPEAGHERDSDKQVVDRNIMALRQMARDMDTCVFAISSLNRSSYAGCVSLDSFKESGAIEYGTDLLLGLQPAGMERELEDVPEQRSKAAAKRVLRDFRVSENRECELVVLKNRNGRIPREGVALTYDALCNTFLEY